MVEKYLTIKALTSFCYIEWLVVYVQKAQNMLNWFGMGVDIGSGFKDELLSH